MTLNLSIGFTNSSLYAGEIEYVDLATTESYWILSLACKFTLSYVKSIVSKDLRFTAITVQGSSITVPSGSSSFAAIDTGTTLVGGPSNVIAEIYAQIPGSQAGSGNFEGYYTYRA
jgi:cathepsin D